MDRVHGGGLDYVSQGLPDFGVVEFRARDRTLAYVSDRVWEMLGVSDPEAYMRSVRNDVFSLVPSVDQFQLLETAKALEPDGESRAFDIHLWHSEGYLIEVEGWITLSKAGKDRTYRLVMADATQQRSRERKYRRALRVEHFRRLYDVLFLFDTVEQSALCYRYGEGAPLAEAAPFDVSGSIRTVLSDALEFLVQHLAAQQDQEALAAFLRPLLSNQAEAAAASYRDGLGKPAASLGRISKRIVFKSGADGWHAPYEGTLIDAEAGAFFFGCRRFVDEQRPPAPNATAGAGTVLCLPSPESGTVLMSVEGDRTHVLFANERGRTLFAGNAISGTMMRVDDLPKICPVTREQIRVLLDEGEATIPGVRSDLGTSSWRMVRMRESGGSTRDLVMVLELPPNMDASRAERAAAPLMDAGVSGPDVFIRTFGYFDVFLDGKAIVFNSSKAKELLALLVDRRGGYVSPAEAISYLWEDEAATQVVLARHRKVAMRLKNTLEENGIGHIVETVKGKRCLNVAAVRCDLYDYLAGRPGASFTGTYLQNYSWGEMTLGELLSTMPFHP